MKTKILFPISIFIILIIFSCTDKRDPYFGPIAENTDYYKKIYLTNVFIISGQWENYGVVSNTNINTNKNYDILISGYIFLGYTYKYNIPKIKYQIDKIIIHELGFNYIIIDPNYINYNFLMLEIK